MIHACQLAWLSATSITCTLPDHEEAINKNRFMTIVLMTNARKRQWV